MSNNLIIWGSLVLVYAMFWFWYVGFNNKIDPSEEAELIERLHNSGLEIDEQQIKQTILEDDGKDFVIVNLVKLNEPREENAKALEKYSMPFMLQLFKRAGHPVMYAKAAGPAIEYWGLEAGAEEWDMVAAVRYRSRRDMFEMVVWPEFSELHPFKKQAIEKTIAFPAGPWTTLGGVQLQFALILIIFGLIATRFT